MYSTLFNKIEAIFAISESREETWAFLALSGRYQQQYSKTIFQELFDVLDGMGKAGCITFRVGNTPMVIEELLDTLVNGVQWTVNINKQSFMGGEEEINNFFYNIDAFKQWAEQTDPFSAANPLNCHVCKIEVNGLPSSFGGPNFLVSDNIGVIPNNVNLTYEHDRLKFCPYSPSFSIIALNDALCLSLRASSLSRTTAFINTSESKVSFPRRYALALAL